MIEPLEVILAYLAAQAELAALVGARIAAKHGYASSWARVEPGVVVTWDGGAPDLYLPVQTGRFEVRIYGPSPYTALRVWRVLVAVSRGTSREAVAVTEGTALLYSLTPDSQPSLLYDDALEMDFVMCFFQAAVGETPLPL